jgi:hypothetical protein
MMGNPRQEQSIHKYSQMIDSGNLKRILNILNSCKYLQRASLLIVKVDKETLQQKISQRVCEDMLITI